MSRMTLKDMERIGHYPICEALYCGCLATHGRYCEAHSLSRDEDGGASGLTSDVSTPANQKEEALRARLERLIEQWTDKEQEICRAADVYDSRGQRIYARQLSIRAEAIGLCRDSLSSSLTSEREP